MATYVLNVSGIQKLQLCNLLYKSCLYVDTDLSTAFFHIEEQPTGLSAEPQACLNPKLQTRNPKPETRNPKP